MCKEKHFYLKDCQGMEKAAQTGCAITSQPQRFSRLV